MAVQREWLEKDYYQILGVSDTAETKDITKAYRKLARELHPDANPGNAKSEERFKEVSGAYDVLGDDVKRKEYDEARRAGPLGGFGGPGGNSFNVGADGLQDLLGGLFGQRSRRGSGAPGRAGGPKRGSDLQTTVTLEFADAARGITTTLHLTSDAVCSVCDGRGAAPGSSPRVCGVCAGRGVTDDNQGFFSFSTPCVACQGRGTIIDTPCPGCRGRGVERRPREVKVRIPGGVADGQTIRLTDRGEPGRNGGPAGDLLVECKVLPHPLFQRDGQHLVLRLPVTYPEAVAGGDVLVPTLEGSTVTLRLRPGTQPGSKHRVRGKGISTPRATGDLIVVIDVVVPSSPTPDELVAVEELRKVTSVSPRDRLT